MAALKDMFDKQWVNRLAAAIQLHYPEFNKAAFSKNTVNGFAPLELNDRMRHTATTLHQYLPGPYTKNIEILKKVVLDLPKGYTNLVFPDYVSQHGLSDFDTSMDALHYFTRFGSSEFAIRHFLKRDFKKTLSVMKKWAGDENEHVRRLASEGSRPRLPWSFQLPAVIEKPSHTLPVLQALVFDDSPYVNKSVANHLNDFSKDHPDLVIQFVKQNFGKKTATDKLLKHACRTLLKSGHSEVLAIFGTASSHDLQLNNFEVHTPTVSMGNLLSFTFTVINTGKKILDVRLEFALYFLLLNGSHYRKVFKISERKLTPSTDMVIQKSFSFRPITTRQYRPGLHRVGIIVNGVELACADFQLLP
ncbi:MAG: DNA alkylation repair protein [Saprospiraceae bacterium]